MVKNCNILRFVMNSLSLKQNPAGEYEKTANLGDINRFSKKPKKGLTV